MASDDYTPTVRGGLKLKGSVPTGIKKKKSSKPKDKPSTSSEPSTDLQKALEEEDASIAKEKGKELDEAQLKELEQRGGDGKTASERAYEEMRRKRLADRIAREGPKTHKQRVEELNKYLSTLSEHHDMPRIGPG